MLWTCTLNLVLLVLQRTDSAWQVMQERPVYIKTKLLLPLNLKVFRWQDYWASLFFTH